MEICFHIDSINFEMSLDTIFEFLNDRIVLLQCGETQAALAGELANCDMEIDEKVISPLSKLLEVSRLRLFVLLSRICFCSSVNFYRSRQHFISSALF